MISQDDIEQLRRLMELREAKDVADEAFKAAKSALDEAEAEVHERLAQSTVKGTLKVDLGEPWGEVGFRPRETYFARIIDEDEAIEYFRQRARLDEYTAPKFVMKRLNAEVRDAVEQGASLPPGVDWYARRGVTITRQKD